MSQVIALLLFIVVNHATNATSKRSYCGVPFLDVILYVSKDILAHDDATGTSELSDVVARSQGEDMHASSAAEIHWRGGASMRHLRSVYLRRMSVTPSVYYSDMGGGFLLKECNLYCWSC